MNIFKRLFKFFQAKANAMVNNLEDPEDLIEQKLEDLRAELSKNLESLSKIKALAIRTKNESDLYSSKAKGYEIQAIAVLKKAQRDELDADEADRLAKEALIKKETLSAKIKATVAECERLDYKVELLKGTVGVIKSNILDWENELKLLKVEQNINEQMAHRDTLSIKSRLEFLNEKTAQSQHLNAQPDDITDAPINLDDDIDFTMDTTTSKVNEALKKLKEQLDIKNSN